MSPGLPYLGDAELSRLVITQAKKTPERAWLSEVSAVALQQALADLNSAFRAFFASLSGRRKGPKVGAPRFRSRKDSWTSIRFTRNARWSITEGGRLRLPKIGDVAVRWSRRLPSIPSSVTVTRDATGRFFASFVVEAADGQPTETGREVGVDLGLTNFAVLSDGRKITNPRFLRRAEKKLRKAQRDLSRKRRGSSNRKKAVVRVAKAHARVADARREFHHQLSTFLVRENQAVCVETLNVRGLARTRLGKSVRDVGWAQFLAMLEYKAELCGRHFFRVPRDFPSSQICSTCGHRDGPKQLHIRAWTCSACHAEHDRDHNAALNVLHEGRRIVAARQAVPATGRGAETQNACGEPVRPPFAVARFVEPGTHQKPEAA